MSIPCADGIFLLYDRRTNKKNGDASVRPHKNVFGNSTNENSRCEYSSKQRRDVSESKITLN